MAPPPNLGDATNKNDDDPLGGMDPMAWLESLAARQGANLDELTTAHNLDIPEMPADTVIDEPGYTPGYDTGKTVPASPAKAEQPAAPPTPPAPAPQPVASTASSDDPLGGMDPMAWLESLAARQGANLDELTTAHNLDIPEMPADTVIDEPGYVDYDPFGGTGVSRQGDAAKASQPPAPTPAPEPVGIEDPLGGMDALSWLESLASQQDSEALSFTEEFTFDDSAQAAELSAADNAASMGIDADAVIMSEPVNDPLGGMDPMTWLENLAAGQGPDIDALISSTNAAQETANEADIESSFFAAPTQPSGAAMEPESALSWLEDLSKGQPEPQPNFAAESPVDEAGGMSNDINEVQAWLEAQARNLEQTRVDLESDSDSDELAPAEPASELPAWLQASIGQPGAPTLSTTPALSDEIATPTAPEDLPSWLLSPSDEAAVSFDADLVEAIRATGTMPAVPQTEEPALSPDELEALTTPASPDEVDSWAEALDEEYERKVAGDESVPDWYMEALERAESQLPQAELPRSIAAEQAPEKAAEPEVAPAVSEMPDWLREMSPVEQPPQPLPGDVPDWLSQMIPAQETPVAQPSAEAADWLQGEVEEDDFPTWLRTEVETPPTPAPAPTPVQEVPATLPPAPVQPVPAATPQPALAAQPPAPTPVAPAQPVAAPVQQTRPAPQAPRAPALAGPAGPEHHARLKQARELVAQRQAVASLEHYQVLIDAAQLLEETRGDLRQLVEQNPKEPKLRRLLGDTHMRLGDLQEALDTYRSALDQL